MAVSKRTRFEVLKRDNHTCRYCGATAPDAILTVDHVTPVALGGTDDPSNLVAACRDCNYGKASTSPDATVVANVAEDAVRWAAAITRAAEESRAERQRNGDIHERFKMLWASFGDKDWSYLPSDFRQSVDGWLDSGLPVEDLIDSLEIAMGNRAVRFADVFRYMAGINKNKLAKLHERARQILDQEAG